MVLLIMIATVHLNVAVVMEQEKKNLNQMELNRQIKAIEDLLSISSQMEAEFGGYSEEMELGEEFLLF